MVDWPRVAAARLCQFRDGRWFGCVEEKGKDEVD